MSYHSEFNPSTAYTEHNTDQGLHYNATSAKQSMGCGILTLISMMLISLILVGVIYAFITGMFTTYSDTYSTYSSDLPATTAPNNSTPPSSTYESPKMEFKVEDTAPLSGDSSTGMNKKKYQLIDTPTKNISCEIYEDRVACSIAERYYEELGLPDCSQRLFSITVTDSGVSSACGKEYLGQTGDYVRELQYGQEIYSTNRQYKCSLEETGMTCKNVNTGHGFKIARREQVRF